MKKNKQENLLDLDPQTLKNKEYTEIDNGLARHHDDIHKIKLDNKIYYVKSLDVKNAIATTASAKMYSEIGINTPKIQVFKDKTDAKNQRSIIQPDVMQLPNIEAILAKEDVEYKKIFPKFNLRYKWEIFYDMNVRKQFLKFMTKDCLESLLNIYLIDELRSDIDRHTSNYFLYKTSKSNLYEGVIAIDLDQMQIYNYSPTKREEFSAFVASPYTSITPTQKEDYLSYMNRIHMLRDLIDDGVMSSYNIETMVKALKHDFPKDIKLLCREQKLSRKLTNQTYSPIARLWEYNQKELGKDLGL